MVTAGSAWSSSASDAGKTVVDTVVQGLAFPQYESRRYCGSTAGQPMQQNYEWPGFAPGHRHVGGDAVEELLAALAGKGIAASVVGEVVPREEGLVYLEHGEVHRLEHPRVDPFWAAFGRAMAEERGGD